MPEYTGMPKIRALMHSRPRTMLLNHKFAVQVYKKLMNNFNTLI